MFQYLGKKNTMSDFDV